MNRRTKTSMSEDDLLATGTISRRGLLVGTSATGALLIGTYAARGPILRQITTPIFQDGEAIPPEGSASGSPHETWFEVPTDGNVILYVPKAEMGQGIHTALAQIAVEDLELRMDQLDIRAVNLVTTSNGTLSRGFGGLTTTAGSRSISGSYAQLRNAANMLKEMLLIEGAVQLGTSRALVEAFEGVVRLTSDLTKSVSYASIVQNRKGPLGSWAPPTAVPVLKSVSDFRVIGTSATRVDAPAKVTGTAVFGFDARVDGLLFGAVARPPRYGARLVGAKSNNAEKAAGVVSVVIDIPAGFVGVVATTRKRAYEALGKIKCTWQGGSTASDKSIVEQLDNKHHGFDFFKRGDAPGQLNDVNTGDIIEQQYYVPAVAHAHLEPLAAMADVQTKEVRVWVATQQPQAVSTDIAAVLKTQRTVVVHSTYLGGGFGRKFLSHVATDAVRLSEASGKPVQVALTREEDMAMGPFRPPTLTKMRGRVADGRAVAIDQHTLSGAGDQQLLATLKLVGVDVAEPPGLISPYRGVANYRINATSRDLDIPTGIWRGVGLLPNSFANESFMDELAHAAKADPLQFRLDHLPDDRVSKNFARLLTEVGKRSNWDTALPAGQGRGIGAAAMAGTVITAVVQVTVLGAKVVVDQIYVCVDPGLVINPAGAKLQVAGGVMMSLSSAFGEQMTFENGMAVTTNLDSYYLLKADQAPPIDVHLMGSGEHPAGLGEPGVGPVCGALGNAIFAATGKRLRSLPFAL
jgi:isoquinoline 1-oxidoreductase subunit beta